MLDTGDEGDIESAKFKNMKNNILVNIHENRKATIIPQSRLPKLMSEICERLVIDLNAFVVDVMNEAATLFLELADQAKSDEEQSLYFLAATQLNSRRNKVEEKFSEHLSKSFVFLLNTDLQMPQNKHSIRLSEQEKLVINVMVDKANSATQSEVWQLTSRLDLLLSDITLNATNTPLSPLAICNIFLEVIELVEFHAQAKLTLYSILEQALIIKLNKVYNGINQQLAENGVLPNLAGFNAEQQAKYQSTAKDAAVENPLKSAKQADTGSDFLTALRALKIDNPALNRKYSSAAVAKFSALGAHQIIDALSNIQNTAVLDTSTQTTNSIRQIVAEAFDISNVDANQLLDKNCDDIIAGISMLFDFIVKDVNLSGEFKFLIIKLQVPILKVALLDATFFKNASHPARCLLNDLAAAGVGWSQGGGIGLKDKAEQLVNKILIEFKNDITVFAQTLLEFQSFNEQHKKRAYLIERRLQEAEKGKAQAETAKLKAEQAIQNIISDRELPASINHLLQEDWKRVMLLTYLREGDESKAWLRNYKTAEQLITSLSDESISSVSLKLDTLAENIKLGLEVVNYGEYESNELFKDLEQLYARVQKGEKVTSSPKEFMPFIESELLDADEIINYSDIPLPAIEEVSHLEEEQPQIEQHEFVISLVEDLQVGGWFELNHNDKSVRCKLAAIISSINKYIFVDYTGKKIAEYSKPNLVQVFKDKKIIQLEEGALFDRALKAILENTREQIVND